MINFSSPTTYDEYPQNIGTYEIEMKEDYSLFDENLNDGDYDYYKDENHSIPIFYDYSQEHDDNHTVENDSLPLFDAYSQESDEFNTIVNVSPPVFDEYFSEDEYIEIEVIEDYTSLKYDDNPLYDKQEMDENDFHGTYEGKDNEYFEVIY